MKNVFVKQMFKAESSYACNLDGFIFRTDKIVLTCMESPDFNTVCVRLEIYRYHKPYNCTKPLSQNLNAAISN